VEEVVEMIVFLGLVASVVVVVWAGLTAVGYARGRATVVVVVLGDVLVLSVLVALLVGVSSLRVLACGQAGHGGRCSVSWAVFMVLLFKTVFFALSGLVVGT